MVRLPKQQQQQQQRRSARLRARAAGRVLPEATESIVQQAREAYERARPFPFTRLPGELRDLVYECLVAAQNAAAGPQALHAVGGGGVALPGLARAGRALRAEYLAVFFRRRAFEVQVYCDLAAWRVLHRTALVASFLGSLAGAVRALPGAAPALAQSRHYGRMRRLTGPLRRLWAEAHAPRPGDGPAVCARRAARAAAGPLLAHLVVFVGGFLDEPVRAIAHTPAARNYWTATLSREPVTGRLLFDHRAKPASPKYENDLFVQLANSARKKALDIIDSQDGTFQGWSVEEIAEICGRFRFWKNHRCPKEFEDEAYSDDDNDD